MEIDVLFVFQKRPNYRLTFLYYFCQICLLFLTLRNYSKTLILYYFILDFMWLTKIDFVSLVQIFYVLDLCCKNHFTINHLRELGFLRLNFAIIWVFKNQYFFLVIQAYLFFINLYFILTDHFIQMFLRGFFNLFKHFVFIANNFKFIVL